MSVSLLGELAMVSAELGADLHLVQGAGGNTSVKVGDRLWVKASGAWMRDALNRNIFAEVSLPPLLDFQTYGDFEAMEQHFKSARTPDDLRPSIETSLHALMPHAAVVHAHAVNSVVVSVLAGGQARFEQALGRDLRGVFIPYIKPGAPLAAGVVAALADHGPADVLLLQNHGIVVGADRPRAAAELLREVERRLAFPVRVLPSADVGAARAHECEDYSVAEGHCGAALDRFLFDLLTRAPLTPDQVVFLGGAVCACGPDSDVSTAARAALVYKAGIGAFKRRDCTPGALSMIDALLDVALRIPEGVEMIGLSSAAAAELLAWDAEKHRKSLDTARR